MKKVKFGDGDLRMVELKATADLEKAQADDAVRKHTRMLRRIDSFYEAIDYVAFSSTEDAPMWAEHWKEWLQTGIFPVPEELVEETDAAEKIAISEEINPADQPDDEPDDEPDPPLAATG